MGLCWLRGLAVCWALAGLLAVTLGRQHFAQRAALAIDAARRAAPGAAHAAPAPLQPVHQTDSRPHAGVRELSPA